MRQCGNEEHPGTGALLRAPVSKCILMLRRGELYTSCKGRLKLKLFSVNAKVHKSFMYLKYWKLDAQPCIGSGTGRTLGFEGK